MKNKRMLKINNDAVTIAVQKDVHEQMQREGVENFCEFVAALIGRTPNNVRERMKKGDWLFAEVRILIAKTNGKNLRKVLKDL